MPRLRKKLASFRGESTPEGSPLGRIIKRPSNFLIARPNLYFRSRSSLLLSASAIFPLDAAMGNSEIHVQLYSSVCSDQRKISFSLCLVYSNCRMDCGNAGDTSSGIESNESAEILVVST